MPSGRNLAVTGSPLAVQTPQAIVCIVTADNEFRSLLTTELLPWFKVVARDNYEDLARWTRESHVSAVVLDIDTEGKEPFGGLPVLDELRRLNDSFTLISVSRARSRSV